MINPHSHREAKEFFIQKVIAQAENENFLLSRAEKYMLHWSEKDPSFHIDQTLIEEFETETSEAEYEKKISRLIVQAYDKEIELDNTAKDKYRQAYKALKSQDNYLFIMVDKAIGRHFNKIGLFFGSYPVGGEYILRFIFSSMLSLFCFLYVLANLMHNQPISIENFKVVLPQLIFGVLFGGFAFSNIRKYKQYRKEKF